MRTVVIVAPNHRVIDNEMYRMVQDLPLAEAKHSQHAVVTADVTYRFYTAYEVAGGKVRGIQPSSVIWLAQHLMVPNEWRAAKEELAWISPLSPS